MSELTGQVAAEAVDRSNAIPRRRILWLSHLLNWPPRGGVQQRSYYLMRELARYHDVEIIAFRQRAQQPDSASRQQAIDALKEFATVREVVDLPEDTTLGGRKRMALRSLLPGAPYTIRWGTAERYARAVQDSVAEFQPQVVHFDTISLAPYLAEIGNLPAMLNHHNIESQMMLRRAENESNPAKRLYFLQEGRRLANYERRVAKRFHVHLTCSELDSRRLIETVGDVATQVIPNGVDLDYFRPAEEDVAVRPDSLVFVGGLTWYPNIDAMRFFLNEVWPLLKQQRPGAHLSVIGRRPKRSPAMLQGIADVDLLGFVEDIRPLVHTSAVYVCPIRDGGGTKLKVLDAMAMGKAIVAHPVACEGLDLEDGKQVLMAHEPQDFASKAASLLADPVRRQELQQAAYAHVSANFSFKEIGERLARTASAAR